MKSNQYSGSQKFFPLKKNSHSKKISPLRKNIPISKNFPSPKKISHAEKFFPTPKKFPPFGEIFLMFKNSGEKFPHKRGKKNTGFDVWIAGFFYSPLPPGDPKPKGHMTQEVFECPSYFCVPLFGSLFWVPFLGPLFRSLFWVSCLSPLFGPFS